MKLAILRFALFALVLSAVLVPTSPAQSQIVAWGRNIEGQCNVPALPPGRTYVAVSTRWQHVIALRSDGSAVGWGWNLFGQCDVPALPAGLTYTSVSAGFQHSLACRSDGAVVGWGANNYGQCTAPALPAGLTYVEVAAGDAHSLARRSDGSVVAWGQNFLGQCDVPALPPGRTYVQIAAGSYFSVALRSDGSVVAWGDNSHGECDFPAFVIAPHFVGVAAGSNHTLAQMANGTVVAWGSNEFGACDVPGLPAGLAFSREAAGAQHSMGLCTDGSLVGWGQNGLGECDAPALPAGFTYSEVAAGREFTVARVDSHDCNGNGIDDPLDIGAGTSADCDGSGVPDECQLALGGFDCDGNGLLDSCEIAANPALDQNHDGELDACPLECHEYWDPIFGGSAGTDGTVYAMTVFDDGTGPALYVAGGFLHAGGLAANNIAKWDGSAWHALGSGLTGGKVYALAVHDDGSGPALYAGGTFTTAGGAPAARVAKWNGLSWTALAGGPLGPVSALAAYDDGQGANLYTAGGHSLDRWDGASWTHVPSWTTWIYDDYTNVLCVYDDGTGSRLYAGGFEDGIHATLHSWNGASWAGEPHPIGEYTSALAVGDDGNGPALFIGALVHGMGSGLARRDGLVTTNLTGVGYYYGSEIDALQGFESGSGRALFIGGSTHLSGSDLGADSVQHILKREGANWSVLGSGVDGVVYCMCVFDDGSGPWLYVAGAFGNAGGSDSRHIARWGMASGCWHGVICEPGRSGVSQCPCSNPPSGLGLGCDNGSLTGGAQLRATGGATLSTESLLFTTAGETPTATSIVLQGTGQSSTGTAFGHGVNCVAGTLKRLYLKAAVSGSISAPAPGDPSVLARSAQLGDAIAPGTHRYYGVYYRDPSSLGGCSAQSGFNITQQLDVLWQP